MDTYPRLRKCLVVGIILLFLSAYAALVVGASYANRQLPQFVQQNIQAIQKDVIGQTCLDGNALISSNSGNDYHPRMTTNGLGQPIVVYEQEINASSKKIPVVYSADHGQTWTRQFLVDSQDIIDTAASGILHYPDIVYNAPNDLLFLTMIDPDAEMYNQEMGFIQGNIANATEALWFGVSGSGSEGYSYGGAVCTNNFFLALAILNCSGFTQNFLTVWCTYPDFEFPPGMYGFNYDGQSVHQSAPAAEVEMDSNSNQIFIVCETRLDSGTKITIKTNVMNEELITSGEQKDGMDKYDDPEQMPGEYLSLGTDPDVAGSGNRVCVVYVEDGNVICKSSTCSVEYEPGFNWLESTVERGASAPAVYMQGNNVYCAYVKDGNLYLKTSEDGGITWGAAEQKNDVDGKVVAEKGAVDIGKTGIVFTDTRNGNYDIYFSSIITAPAPQIVIDSISGGVGVRAVIRNIGVVPAEYFTWSIKSNGIVFVGKETSGTANLQPGASTTIKTGLMLGFGPISITIIADTAKKTVKADLLLFYVKGV
jgi:hypothetical protein